MSMIQKLTFAGALASIALLAQGPPRGMHEGPWGFGGPGMGAAVTGAPYSGTEVVQSLQTLSDGSQINKQESSKVYRDSQGRTRVERTMPPPPDATTQAARTEITIFDPVAGYVYHLNPQKQTYVQMQIHQHAARPVDSATAPHAQRGEGQGQTETLQAQSINGLTATGTRHTQTIPAGAIGNTAAINVVRERWVSADLKVPVMIKTSDPRFGDTTMNLTNVQRSEPDAALFQIPAGYTQQTGAAGRGFGGRGQHGPPPAPPAQ